ncbi:alpha/beta hydrolase [Pseudenhygromyxa sp. WMMC2535]|uniref:alpha/beta fold hydrolase n=1 Tax=Pseudenhygromyxa sp. WMMC2535 TaxID=2712867 RepID=UPI0015548591|nr:alpha/beta hydrolase [Pseudenhygromyxa sp. WMMC2535]NVB39070.1 alpha/beta hydrolase [Pseudenhygromyxa sp. WMMC2535]
MTRSSRRSWMTLAALAPAACAFVAQRERGLERKFARAGLDARRYELGEARVHAWCAAGGTPVLMLHGFGASGIWQWHRQVPALVKSGYAPIVPDLLWFGGSEAPADQVTIPDQARAMAALLDALEIEELHMIGISYGGMVAHELLSIWPGRVRSVTLVSSPGRAFLASDQDELRAAYGVSSMSELLLPRTPDEVRRLFDLAYARPPRVPRFIRAQVLEHFYRAHREARERMLASIQGDIDELRAHEWVPREPTQIIWGEHDEIFPLLSANRLREELGALAQLVVIPDAGHAPQLEQAKVFNAAWFERLAEVDA